MLIIKLKRGDFQQERLEKKRNEGDEKRVREGKKKVGY